MSHIMETGYRHTAAGQVVPRDIITSFTCRYQRRRDFPRRPVSGDRGQPVHHVLHGRDRKREIRFRMDRRQRLCRYRFGHDLGRMRSAVTIVVAALLIAAGHRHLSPRRDRNPTSRAPIRLHLHDAGYQGDAGRRYRQSRHAVGARRRSLVEQQGRCCGQGLRRLPQRCARQHEGRGGALSRLRQGAWPPGQSGTAHQSVPRAAPGGHAVRL